MLIRYSINNTIHIIEEYNSQSGWEYNSDSWKKSETIDYLRRHELWVNNYKLYSNEPEAVYILTNLKTRRSPSKTFYNSQQLFKNIIHQIDIWMNEKKVCLIWFDNNNRSFLFTIEELQKTKNITEVAHLKDGKIYPCTNKYFGIQIKMIQ